MQRKTALEADAIELYTLLGHQVERVIGRSGHVSDLVIKSNKGEKWIVRCYDVPEVSDADIRDLFPVLQSEEAKQSTVIVNGAITAQIRQAVLLRGKGRPIHLLDRKQFYDYLDKARVSVHRDASVSAQSASTGTPTTSQTKHQKLKKCPYCAEEVQEAAIVCRFCGRDLLATLSTRTPSAEPVAELVHTSTIQTDEKTVAQSDGKLRARRSGIESLLIVAIGVLVVVIIGYVFSSSGRGVTTVAPTQPCYARAGTYMENAENLFDDWDDANKLAGQTARIALSPVVADLQRIRREIANLYVPSCAARVHKLMIDYMDATIDGYLAFMADQPDTTVSDRIKEASDLFDKFTKEYAKLRSGVSPYDK